MWVPTQKTCIEQQLPVFPESDNTHDKKAVAVYKDGSVVATCGPYTCTIHTHTHIYVNTAT